MRHVLALGVLFAAAGTARAAVIPVTVGDDLRAMLIAAQPGDEFVLAAGTYDLGTVRTAISVLATLADPVIVRSASGVRAVLSRPNTTHDVLNIENSRHVVLRGLEIAGGLSGVRIAASNDVTVDGCIVQGAAQDGVAVTAPSGSLDQVQAAILVRLNEIHDVGGAGVLITLGLADTLEDNAVHDTGGDGIRVVGDATGTIIERNAVWRVAGNGITAARGVVIRNNIVLAAGQFAVGNTVGSASVGNLQVLNNTLVGDDGIQLSQPQAGVVVANNAIYASDIAIQVSGPVSPVDYHANIGFGSLSGAADPLADGGSVSAAFVDAGALDVYPRSGGPLIGAGDAAFQPSDDFNATSRSGTHDAGAYVFAATGNPGGDGGPAVGGGDGRSNGDVDLDDTPPNGSVPTGEPAKSEQGCVAALAGWPLVLALGVYLSRPRRGRA